MLEIEQVKIFPFVEIAPLIEESLRFKFNFLKRLETDWANDTNQFNKKGEGLFILKKEDNIIGIGGINLSSFAPPTSGIARLRRFYVSQRFRRKGNGSLLLQHLIKFAQLEFGLLQLKTDNFAAQKFYESNGFEKVEHNLNITHQLEL